MYPTDSAARQAAIQHVAGPLEILAGHGTGKTTLLLDRFAHLVQRRLAWPPEILLLTFTRRAARQMRERLRDQLGEDVSDFPIHTLHGFAYRLLRQYARLAGQPRPRLIEPAAAFAVLKQALAETSLEGSVWPAPVVAGLIADAKERGIGPEASVTAPASTAQQQLAQAYARYQALLAERPAVDFADLVLLAGRQLDNDPAWRAHVQSLCRYIMVDEFQDTSLGQYALILTLLGPERNLFVVGSAAQSIYAWRHADYARLAEAFQADFPEARRIVLGDNFRSTAAIIQAAGALFRAGQFPELALIPRRGAGELIREVRVADEDAEADFVAGEARRLAAAGLSFNQMAVLYRANHQSAPFEHAFGQHVLPYVLAGRQRLYHRREVRDLLAYLTAAAGDDPAAFRHLAHAPPCALSPPLIRRLQGSDPALTWSRLCEAAASDNPFVLPPAPFSRLRQLHTTLAGLRALGPGPPAQLIDQILDRSGYAAWLADELDGERRLGSLRDLRREAETFETAPDFLAAVRARLDADRERPEGEGITLSTIHTAKGLQFEVVFVVGLEEGLLPAARALEDGDEAGERRLAHVAFSRARDHLYLVSAQSRLDPRTGQRLFTRPSRYLSTLPRSIVTRL